MRPIKRILNIYVGPQLQYSPKVGRAPRKPVSAPINTNFAEGCTVGQTYAANVGDQSENLCSKIEFP